MEQEPTSLLINSGEIDINKHFFEVRVLIQMLAATRITERLRTFFWF